MACVKDCSEKPAVLDTRTRTCNEKPDGLGRNAQQMINKAVMKKLTNKEEEVMKILWELEKAFVKDVLAKFTEDKPHYNTLSTIIRNLEEKGYVSHEAYGNTHQYYPVVAKEEYRKQFISGAIEDYFNSSYKNLVSHFASEDKISVEELKEIIKHIEKNN